MLIKTILTFIYMYMKVAFISNYCKKNKKAILTNMSVCLKE